MPKLLYFAQLVDAFGIDSETTVFEPPTSTVAQLLDQLVQRGCVWQRVFTRPEILRIAVNKQFAELGTLIRPNDEIAFVASGPVA